MEFSNINLKQFITSVYHMVNNYENHLSTHREIAATLRRVLSIERP
jgi:hypothetical protein